MPSDLTRPNRTWFADIVYAKFRQAWLYLALEIDIWSRQIVGWAIGPNTTVELADDALKMSLTRRGNLRGCIHHSDHGIRSSMVSISSPWDNAAMESPMGHRLRICA
ncbi:transposase [Collinsella aerofaciens]|uniref:transposase n=1 Tax=Collinsella aerofaciens TaxID=74426 RepID=UPI003D1695D5